MLRVTEINMLLLFPFTCTCGPIKMIELYTCKFLYFLDIVPNHICFFFINLGCYMYYYRLMMQFTSQHQKVLLLLFVLCVLNVRANGTGMFRSVTPSNCCSGDTFDVPATTTTLSCAARCNAGQLINKQEVFYLYPECCDALHNEP